VDSAEYLALLKAVVIGSPCVARVAILREEDQGDRGLCRFRLTLIDGGLLELFEFFRVVADEVQIIRYSYHWQAADGQLRRRWDNAPHHPQIPTHPAHIHDGDETTILPSGTVSITDMLGVVAAELST
jgi:hypothetical protein